MSQHSKNYQRKDKYIAEYENSTSGKSKKLRESEHPIIGAELMKFLSEANLKILVFFQYFTIF